MVRLSLLGFQIGIGVSLYLDKWDWAAWFAGCLLAQIAFSLRDIQEGMRKS